MFSRARISDPNYVESFADEWAKTMPQDIMQTLEKYRLLQTEPLILAMLDRWLAHHNPTHELFEFLLKHGSADGAYTCYKRLGHEFSDSKMFKGSVRAMQHEPSFQPEGALVWLKLRDLQRYAQELKHDPDRETIAKLTIQLDLPQFYEAGGIEPRHAYNTMITFDRLHMLRLLDPTKVNAAICRKYVKHLLPQDLAPCIEKLTGATCNVPVLRAILERLEQAPGRVDFNEFKMGDCKECLAWLTGPRVEFKCSDGKTVDVPKHVFDKFTLAKTALVTERQLRLLLNHLCSNALDDSSAVWWAACALGHLEACESHSFRVERTVSEMSFCPWIAPDGSVQPAHEPGESHPAISAWRQD